METIGEKKYPAAPEPENNVPAASPFSSTTTTFDRIMQSVTAQNAATSTAFAALQQELAASKQQHQEEKGGADDAEASIISLKEQHDAELAHANGDSRLAEEKLQIKITALEADLRTQNVQTKTARRETEKVEGELKDLKREMSETKKHAEEKGEQMEKIWVEMEKGKRTAGDDGESGLSYTRRPRSEGKKLHHNGGERAKRMRLWRHASQGVKGREDHAHCRQ